MAMRQLLSTIVGEYLRPSATNPDIIRGFR